MALFIFALRAGVCFFNKRNLLLLRPFSVSNVMSDLKPDIALVSPRAL
jgi:hypothetical protein